MRARDEKVFLSPLVQPSGSEAETQPAAALTTKMLLQPISKTPVFHQQMKAETIDTAADVPPPKAAAVKKRIKGRN